jgi:hypothetical protein
VPTLSASWHLGHGEPFFILVSCVFVCLFIHSIHICYPLSHYVRWPEPDTNLPKVKIEG